MKDVFISYSNKDSELAHQLRDCVEREGYSCWMAPDDIKGPKTFAEQIPEAIRRSRSMIVLVSGGANSSAHIPREVSLAGEGNTPILPVRVEDVLPTGALEYLLQLRQWVDAFPGSVEDHIEALKAAIDAVIEHGGDASADESEQTEPATAGSQLEYLAAIGNDESSTLWRVHDTILGRDIGVRELHLPEGMSAEEASLQWERIEREIAKAACLKHPNVGEVYRAWRTGDRFMVSSELLEGETLETKLSLGPLPPRTALTLLVQIASAVSFEHRKGVAHGGLRPWNVFLTPEGKVRLAGGIVAFSPGVAEDPRGERSAMVDPMGSAGYLAPEQLKGSLPSELADEFSLAVLANEMLTGRNPFGAGVEPDEDRVVRRTLEQPLPSVAASGIDFPQARAVDDVLARASAKDPAGRYPSVAEFWNALREAWSSAPPVAPVASTAVVAEQAPAVAAAEPAAAEVAVAAASTVPFAAQAVEAEAVAAGPPAVEPVVAQTMAVESLSAEMVGAGIGKSAELTEPIAQTPAAGPIAAPVAEPTGSRRRRTVLIWAIVGVLAAGLVAGGLFAIGKARSGGSADKLPASQASTEPTAGQLLESAGKALAAGDYSVATSQAAAASQLDPSLEASATQVIDEANRLTSIAQLKPLADAAFAKQNWSEAVSDYTRLVKLDPTNATFKSRLATAKKQGELLRLYLLGRKYQSAHSWSKAKKAYEQVLAMDKKYRDAAKRLATVEAALNPPTASSGSSHRSSGGGGSTGGGGSSGGGGSTGGGGEGL